MLHAESGASEITSPDFFLSAAQSPEAELSETLKRLKSKFGQETACNFPARYQLLQESFDLPKVDLKLCPDLTSFIKSFQKQKLSLVLASELMNAPASAFGHLMLIFHSDERPFDISDTIHFAALNTQTEAFIKYAAKGLTGGHKGYFFRDPFFIKKHEYLYEQQRSLFIYPVNFSQEEIMRIILHLYELQRAEFSYFFLKKNCAYQISSLLAIGQREPNDIHTPFVLPINIVQRYRSKLGKMKAMIPTQLSAIMIHKQLNSKEKIDFEDFTAGRTTKDLSERTRSALYFYYQFKFRQEGRELPNFKLVNNMQFKFGAPKSNVVDPTDRPFSSRITFGAGRAFSKTYGSFEIRPVLNSLTEPQRQESQESELVALGTTVHFFSDSARLESIHLISAKLMNFTSTLMSPLSWSFYSGLNRENYYRHLRFDNEVGFGFAQSLNDFIKTFQVLGIGAEIYPKKISLYLRPKVGLMVYLLEKLKLSVILLSKQQTSESYVSGEAYLSLQNRNFIFSASLRNQSSLDDFTTQISTGFYF